VLYRTGKSKCTELGGLYKTMPITMILGTIGALAISSVPFTSGFVSKTIIVATAEQNNYLWAWLVLEIASAGVFLHAGIKFPYFVFFNVDRGLRPKEAPKPMLIGMGLLAFLCIYLGCHPAPLYDILPLVHRSALPEATLESTTFSAIYVDHFANVVTMFQLLAFSALAFFVFLPLLKRTPTISIDFDWFYRKGAKWFFWTADKSLNGLNAAADKYVIKTLLPALTRFALIAPAALTALVLKPVWRAMDPDEADLAKRRDELVAKFTTGTFPIAYSAACVLIILSLLVLIGRTAD
jgi:multicomponent Na+:H+ antiporter subunit D